MCKACEVWASTAMIKMHAALQLIEEANECQKLIKEQHPKVN
jgi:hypothetical protein